MSSYSSSSSDVEVVENRGVKQGTLRGSYKNTDGVAKQRIVECARKEGDWKAVAAANDVNVQTARRWIRMDEEGVAARRKGGRRNVKVRDVHINRMISLLEENSQITLEGIKQKILSEFGVVLSKSTIHRQLNNKLYTIKKVSCVPVTANTEENKQKRADFVRHLMHETALQKEIFYQDETNINLFCRRREGRSLRGVRCRIPLPSSRGANIHCWGLMGKRGMAYYEICRGSIKSERYNDIMSRALEGLLLERGSLENVIVVIDNAPSHSAVESYIASKPEYAGLTVIRMAPYSAPLSPIEYLWSAVKSQCKIEMSSQLTEILNASGNLTQTEHRLRAMETILDSAVRAKSDSHVCEQYYNHVQRFYADVVDKKDLLYGC